AEESGARIVKIVEQNLRPSRVMTRQAFENAIRVLMAIGGSTNAIVHLVAMAGRLGIELPLARFDEISRATPVIADIKPSGKFLMEDLFNAGGIAAVIKELVPLLHAEALTVTGKALGENVRRAACYNREVIRPLEKPLQPEGGTAVLKGNLAPSGAVIKQSAASPELLKHRGRSRNARVGASAHPHKTSQSRCQRRGAAERCAHQRHELRNAHRPRGARGR